MKRIIFFLLLISTVAHGQRYFNSKATLSGSSTYQQILDADVPSNFLRSQGSTFTFIGNQSVTFTFTGTTSVTFPTSGALATLGSPTFTGIPAGPTASPGTNTTQLATTAFVAAAVTAGSISDGDKGDITVTGSGSTWTIDASAVTGSKIASNVALAGSPTTTTQSAGDNSTKISTTAYVDTGLATMQPLDANLITLATPGAAGYKVQVNSGGTDYEFAAQLINPSTTNGDVIYYDGLQYQRLGIGSTSQVLTVAGGVPSWATPFSNPMTTVGDLIQGGTSGAAQRLASVSAGSFLLSTGVGAANTWSTTKWPNALTTNAILGATTTNTAGALTGITSSGYSSIIHTPSGTSPGPSIVVGTQTAGSITMRASSSDNIFSESYGTIITTGATTQNIYANRVITTNTINHTGATLYGYYYSPTINGSQTPTHYAAVFGSGSVGIGTLTPNAASLLDITSTTKGILWSRGTTTQRDAISSPVDGLHFYNTSTHTDDYYNGTAWKSIGPISGSFSGSGSATTVFTVTIGVTMPTSTYKVVATPTASLSAALFYITNKTTTTFDVTYLSGLTGTVTFDWMVTQ